MLYLNNPLLLSNSIIASFETNVINGDPSMAPSPLNRFKSKLKSIYFSGLDKLASDELVLESLRNDKRFSFFFPKLTKVLDLIFSLKDSDDKSLALKRLTSIEIEDKTIDDAKKAFKDINALYGYFDLQDFDLETIALVFYKLSSACRTISILFENQNDDIDAIGYQYAYALMALLVEDEDLKNPHCILDKISKETYKLLSHLDHSIRNPFHQVLIVNLSLPEASGIRDRSGWRKLIRECGIVVFPYFADAKLIEEKIKETDPQHVQRAPKTLQEAQAMNSLCTYFRAAEDPLFAEICNRYEVNKNRFEACLNFLAQGFPQKETDSIPDIFIKGEGVAENLYWIKMPASDKRALIMGDITDCCLSINGNAEQCVKDVVNLSDNAFYVLLKKSSKGEAPFTVNNGINDKDYKIVGQAYVWRSTNNNICLDSLEFLSFSVSKDALKKIVFDFATKVLKENSNIKFITLGKGGNTPVNLFPDAIISEKMIQGYSYGDAITQYCIARSPNDTLSVSQRKVLNTLLAPYSESFRNCIDYLVCYIKSPEAFVDQLPSILKNYPTITTQLSPLTLAQLFYFTNTPATKDLLPVDFARIDTMTEVEKKHFLADLTITQLFWRETSVEGIVKALKYLPKDKYNEATGKILEIACFNQDRIKLITLKDQYGFRPTEQLIKQIPYDLFLLLLEQPIFFVVDELKHQGYVLLKNMNRDALTWLLCSTLIADANPNSNKLLDHQNLKENIINILNAYKSTTSSLTNKDSSSFFNSKFKELRDEADSKPERYWDSSIIEID